MNKMLEETFEKVRHLPEADQEHARAVLDRIVAEAAALAENDEDLKDPAYRAYVEQALAESEADVAAGRVYTSDEMWERLKSRQKTRYG